MKLESNVYLHGSALKEAQKQIDEQQVKRLNIDDPNVWNKWRELYDELTDKEHADFLNDSEARYPNQKSFKFENYDYLFNLTNNHNCRVVEVGGWRGELAHECLSKHNISTWLNIDLCSSALDKIATNELRNDPRYIGFRPNKFRWFEGNRIIHSDVLISAHTIEHLSDKDMIKFMYWLKDISIVMLEAPIGMSRVPSSHWHNYLGSHKLEMGWDEINALMELLGFSVELVNNECFLYRTVR